MCESSRGVRTVARDCYSEPTKLGTKENFVEIFLFDGLFIIELFRKFSHVVETDRNDPIFNSNLMRTRVVRDLLLLENQIPMLVLQTLFDLSYDPKSDRFPLIILALNFFKDLVSYDKDYYTGLQNIEPTGHKHLLDLLSYALENSLPAMVLWPASRGALESLPCVTELQHSGVNFRKRLTRSGWMDIEFRDGVFEIPTLRVDEYTDPFFRNLIAYEQHRSGGRHYITSYALLIDSLIDTADDVAFLRRHKIIVNHLGDDSKVSSLFNSLCTEVVTNNFYYKDLCDDVRQYYYSPCNEWKATWKREYCNSPWTIIPVVAAVFLLFLTVWATLFTTLPVFNVNFKH
ncbi:UPF0481 protein At3g47200-like [Macadamia integrifolia]|uniref:UPF0481 protein At3g47200-like n=1 Tax=Macadamia integrifolia TaxID=60698 RepID=UPI001C4EFB33|nr:UPF0481 protein At3g47200-like [Macadamia integrifolia]XP_042498249.1 UPF0481 protein At3g47200-like [Macadamia integrifolia]XP_042498259.1 UPF0481 protein At3g47200-like [Macadamia integrifolia]XP_042498268.1 UPF0481 protein At3g47200-like [Macadamia integrifolia]